MCSCLFSGSIGEPTFKSLLCHHLGPDSVITKLFFSKILTKSQNNTRGKIWTTISDMCLNRWMKLFLSKLGITTFHECLPVLILNMEFSSICSLFTNPALLNLYEFRLVLKGKSIQATEGIDWFQLYLYSTVQ